MAAPNVTEIWEKISDCLSTTEAVLNLAVVAKIDVTFQTLKQ